MRGPVLIALAISFAIGCGSSKTEAPSPDKTGQAEPVTAGNPASVTASNSAPASVAASNSAPVGDSARSEVEGPVNDAPCPVTGDDARDPDKLLDMAGLRHRANKFSEALACADIAADLVPRSVEAHHVRAAALAGLGRYDEALLAFNMALALDPNDPETLAAAAHFYINVLPPKRRETTLLGLELAHRGSVHATSRRRRDHGLRARLSLLEAQALNDLARADEALKAVNVAIGLTPKSVEARYERGVALFNLCRFEESTAAFATVLRQAPDDPYVHHHLGLMYERDGRVADAAVQFELAWSHPGGEFSRPVDIGPAAFKAEVDAAIAELSRETRHLLSEATIEIAEIPALDDLVAVDPPFAPTILGLFRGLPVGVAGDPKTTPPRAIVLYRANLARAVKTREELDRQLRRTLQHEIGHLAGLDEDELRRRGLD